MTYEAFLERIIDNGIVAARRDYAEDDLKREGAVAGFEACCGKTPDELGGLLHAAREANHNARSEHKPDYWKTRCYEAEIEWVCNCVSALLMLAGKGTVIPPTGRALIHVSRVMADFQKVADFQKSARAAMEVRE